MGKTERNEKRKEGRVCHRAVLNPIGSLLRSHIECTLGLLLRTSSGSWFTGCFTCYSLPRDFNFWNRSAGS